MSPRRTVMRVAVLLVATFLCRSAVATTIDPLTWEELIVGADFVGIVECETAGGIVAKLSCPA